MKILSKEEIENFDKTIKGRIQVMEAGKIVSEEILSLEVKSLPMQVFLSSLYYDLEETIKDIEHDIQLEKEK